MNYFTIDQHKSTDYGIIMTAPPPMILAEEDVETVSVPGRSGDIIISKDRYKNVHIPYECAILPEDSQTLRDAAITARKLLKPSANYANLVNTYHQNSYRIARIAESISIDSIVEQAGIFTITFDCKPQRFLFSGLDSIAFNAAGELNNDYFPALPLITVYGSGNGTVSVGGTVVKIIGQVDTIVLDCDTQNAYHETAEGVKENRNSYISAAKFPSLAPGSNAISWTGGVERLEIVPRWWTL